MSTKNKPSEQQIRKFYSTEEQKAKIAHNENVKRFGQASQAKVNEKINEFASPLWTKHNENVKKNSIKSLEQLTKQLADISKKRSKELRDLSSGQPVKDK